MKKLKILLTWLLLTISFCFTSYAGKYPSYQEDRLGLKDGMYWDETILNPYFGYPLSGAPAAGYDEYAPRYVSAKNFDVILQQRLYYDFYKADGVSVGKCRSTSCGITVSISHKSNGDWVSNTEVVNALCFSNVTGSGRIILKRSPSMRKSYPEYLYVYVNHPKEGHKYTYQSDANYHWGTCVCGATTGKQAHTPVNGKCSVCGRILHTHNSNKKVWVKQPTCTAAGSYYLACSTDNTRMTNDITVPATGHS